MAASAYFGHILSHTNLKCIGGYERASTNSISSFEGQTSRYCGSSAADSFHSLGKTALFNIKEAHNHSFSSKVCYSVNFSTHA
jgi:hypothetical protein